MLAVGAVGAVAAAAPSTVAPATINIKPSQSQEAAVASTSCGEIQQSQQQSEENTEAKLT